MAKKMYEETRIAAVAEKIRELAGTETKYTTGTMPEGVEEVAITGYLAGLTESPLILPHSVSYGTDYIDGIIGDTDTLMLEAFTRTPIAGELFFFIAKTKKNDVVGVTAKVLGLQTDEKGVEWVRFSVEDATLFHSGKEIDDLQETVDSLAIPLHYNKITTLRYVAFEELFKCGETKDQPYSNSFSINDFSRRAKAGDIFSLIFVDRNKNNVYSFAEITSDMVQNSDGEWFYPFRIVYAILLHNTSEITDLKATVNSLKTETWTFTLENGEKVYKEVFVK